jgi:beta-mannosidase
LERIVDMTENGQTGDMYILDLGGAWSVRAADGGGEMPARVPGGIHTDLLAAGKIEDPFFRDNEDRLHWIGEKDWIYARDFDVPAALLARRRVLLRAEGLDTLAAIAINGVEVGRADNMFRTWEFDVRSALRPGANRIEVRFASTLPPLHERQARRPLRPLSHPVELIGRTHIRKEQCNYGWDWGPVCVTCGIWRALAIVAFDAARLAGVRVAQRHGADGAVALDVHVEAEAVAGGGAAAPLSAEVEVSFDGAPVATASAPLDGAKGIASIDVPSPRLWWPNGLGAQPLYEVAVRLRGADGAALDAWRRRVGLRTIRLVREKDEWGESFAFAVNGARFFAKGANWIPADTFATRVTRGLCERLLRSAAAAHMNMLRVWGGGYYEDDAFYDLCDELGLLVWQDFMFACGAYPADDPAFVDSVRAEAVDNVRRLRHHACLALWCGNNELEQMRVMNDDGAGGNMTWAEYRRIFDELLPSVTAGHDPATPYWPSSPHKPWGERLEVNRPECGDAHLWQVWHGRQPFEWYRTAFHRFCSEFGFQSFPEPRTVRGYTNDEERNVTSYVMERHQRSAIGNQAIVQYMLSWYRLPTGFENTLWLSQIQQGLAIQYAVEHWRRNRPRCEGALYWQLNDCWPVASWASIDWHGRWKALHYMARRFFAPVLVTGVEDAKAGTVEVHVCSDRLAAGRGELAWRITNAAGDLLQEGREPVAIPANASARVATIDASGWMERPGPRDLLVWLSLSERGRTLSENLVLFARPKHFALASPTIRTRVAKQGESYVVRLTADAPALWAWLEVEGADADYSDNFFCLVPGVTREIRVTPCPPMKMPAFRHALRVRSLVDTYGPA